MIAHAEGGPPILCLVTDRRRLCPPGATFAAARSGVVDQARDAVDAGIDLIQVREPDLLTADLVTLVSDVLAVTRGTPTRVVVNDRLDVALACGADGVHLRADSIAPAAARSLAPGGFLIGRSVHSVEEAVRSAEAADYLIAGTVFATSSKPRDWRVLGVEGLAEIVGSVRVHVLGIGGVTIERAPLVGASGAAGIAAISLFAPAGRTAATGPRAAQLQAIVREIQARFDSVKTAS